MHDVETSQVITTASALYNIQSTSDLLSGSPCGALFDFFSKLPFFSGQDLYKQMCEMVVDAQNKYKEMVSIYQQEVMDSSSSKTPPIVRDWLLLLLLSVLDATFAAP